MQIQLANTADAKEISNFISRLSRPFYAAPNKVDVQRFLASIEEEPIKIHIGSPDYFCLVARINGLVAGVVTVRCGTHIIYLFIDSPYQYGDIPINLWHEAQRISKKYFQPKEFTVNASLNSLSGYERLGFSKSGSIQRQSGILFQPMRLSI